MAAMGSTVSLCGMMMMMALMIMGAAAQAPAPSVDCQTEVLTLSDCLTYVTGGEKTPPAACCTELSSVIKNNPQCLCLLFNTTFTEPLGVNITLAQQLPPACKLQTPPTSLCSLLGVPVPAPVSSVAPSAAKTPSSAASPTPVPASAPKAASPVSTPMAPSAVAPAVSTVPPTASTVPSASPPANASTTPTDNSGAPSVKSWNVAAAAATILSIASIFLS